MALNINGTTGISGVDGSASAPALQGTDSNTGINFGSDTVNINTGGVARATVDSSGQVGIGTSSPISTLHLHEAGASGSPIIQFSNGDTGATSSDGFAIGVADNESPFIYNRENTDLRFGTNNSERMRIDSSGNVGINQTNPTNKFQVTVNTFNFQISNTNGRLEKSFSGSGSTDDDAFWMIDNDSNTGTYIKFWNTTSGANVIGSITHGTSNTNYNTSSDYRLKENITSISDGITRLKTLKPSRFNFKADTDTIVDGFIAHEVTAVPEAITGTKDAVADKDVAEIGLKKGDPIYQGIDQSKLVPLLTAALQEAIAKIEVLETKVAALEAG